MTITINGTTGIAGVDGSASTPAVQGTDTNTGIFFGTDTVTISTGGTAAVTVDSGQRTKFPTTIGVGGATPAASGAGITFPATQSASSDANTLDDYEEGTWTAVISDGTNNATMNSGRTTGSYTKIGNFVTVAGYISTDSLGSVTGGIRMTGLPFTSAGGNSNYSGCAFPYGENLNITANQVVGGYVVINSTYIQLTLWDATGGTTAMQATEWSADGAVIFNVTYRAA
jgi:hypothetical protein